MSYILPTLRCEQVGNVLGMIVLYIFVMWFYLALHVRIKRSLKSLSMTTVVGIIGRICANLQYVQNVFE